ncbi:LCP family protein [Neomicrococcus lactis]|uniref:LCP family protein required for cell wall assembly n=1 Tax=Neomicrococcus lactis TaxID=732241 RepID=A0A7W8Y9W8_9MICC|nr:LCP family protein [Neomicrococcus lactis]MBB5597507.1 LCP family protein required for cell wall assembly [Neomicrococcus lactis]
MSPFEDSSNTDPQNMDGSRQEPRQRRRKKKTGRNVLLVFGSIVVIAALVAGGFVFNLINSFDNKSGKIADAFPVESSRPTKNADAKDAVNILLLGADSGGGSGENENLANVPNAGRSDTMMLVHVSGDRKNVYVTSIMRDTWIDIPGQGTHKINAAFSYGGVALAVQTIETLLGTRIDHVASVDLAGFKGLTDAVGGLDIDVPLTFKSTHNPGYVYQKGVQHMDGETALAFVRERYAFSDGDYQRVRNQQVYMKALVNKMLSRDVLTNPGTLTGVVDELSPFIQRDDSLNAATLGQLGLSLSNLRSKDLHFFTLPTSGVGRSADGQSIVLPNEAAIKELADALQNDDVATFVSKHGL